ncbi:guanine deaminase NDAI_0H04000 [Naumovozyma dairenensis CBS 421]|uniref:Guanine deaminase n=1 Tax=Naumovozyma dairenensis (strain ATCC 10597 / BCRC 20456 / CBS 421 / NBRC 0211 / NRRL Y-12639) TaxID=1071378 RepID=G0WFL2_NAUDC|nr:hypothetical protein NDAI_0H04000 [Naumovozyma dairenensis CBS 421]CCD26573.1 hypothetical protein NDAI_0H04000 [Naumovozyma dairenensis CBS 421]
MVSPETQFSKFIVYYGTFIDTPVLGEYRIRENTVIGVTLSASESGTIKFIKEDCSDPLAAALSYDPSLIEQEIIIIEFSDNKYANKHQMSNFFFPGFIDTHIHASQYPNSGIFGNSTLLDWLEIYTFPLEASLENLTIAEEVYNKIVQRTLSHGTTTASYFATIDLEATKLLSKICSKKNQRALIGKVCMDRNSPPYYIESTEQSIESSIELIDYLENNLKNPQVLPVLSPRFAPSCSNELMLQLTNISKAYNNLHIQTHLSENKREIKWVSSLFPNCENYTDVYDKYHLLTNKTILAHCVHLSPKEASLIKQRNSGISHCPISNSSLTSGECNVKWLLNQNIKVSLGTDVSAGYSCSILNSARHAHLVSKHLAMHSSKTTDTSYDNTESVEDVELSVPECLYLATMGGARVLDMEDKLGSFEIGKQFDGQLIDLETESSNVDIFTWQYPKPGNSRSERNEVLQNQHPRKLLSTSTFDDLIAKWFFTGDDRNTVAVWVGGKLSHTTIK